MQEEAHEHLSAGHKHELHSLDLPDHKAELPDVAGLYPSDKVSELQHDWNLFKLVFDMAIQQQDSLPDTCPIAIQLTYQESNRLEHEEFGDLLKKHNIIVEADPTQLEAHRALYTTKDGHITFKNVMDEHCEVGVHDLSAHSVEIGPEQDVSCTCSLKKAFEHIYTTKGRVINLLDLPSKTRLFGKPHVVTWVSMRSNHLRYTWDHFPKGSWFLVGGGGAISADHVDASGHATFVFIIAGVGKIWLLCLGPKDSTKDIHNHSKPWGDNPWAHLSPEDHSWVPDYYWQAVFLPTASTL
ncbi:hypothetical protein RhiLY_09238 [Ceratobasidium sp. AG-Ba]|nr:hypothetical protein RhiLY_09238 [Ceratobasidium sp. AG-Ba]